MWDVENEIHVSPFLLIITVLVITRPGLGSQIVISCSFFIKLSLYNTVHLYHGTSTMDPKDSVIKGLPSKCRYSINWYLSCDMTKPTK